MRHAFQMGMWRRSLSHAWFAIAAAAAVSAGCGIRLNPVGEQRSVIGGVGGSYAVAGSQGLEDETAPTCDAPSPRLQGQLPEGAACQTPSDCMPVCCDCGFGSTSWLAASCVSGTCMSAELACGRTSSQFCGVSAPPPVSVPGGTCGDLPPLSPSCGVCQAGDCCTQSEACANDELCTLKARCISQCTDPTCEASCNETYGPDPTFDALDQCLATCGC